MNFNEFYFTEMLVIGEPKDNGYVVAFDKWIWALNRTEEQHKDITDKLGIDLDSGMDDYDFITNIQEKISDILAGQIHGKTLYLYDYGSFKADPKSSVLVKKVVRQLNLNSVKYIEDVDSTETKVTKKKIVGEISDIAYHGTSSKYLQAIISKGLKSGESDSNYAKIGVHHSDLVFFATRIGEAMHHAIHAVQQKKGIAIILEFTIPDKDQIIADFDVEKMTDKDIYYGDTGERGKYTSKSYQQNPDKLSKHFGVYGYKGRIPSSFIKYIYVATKPNDEMYNINDFKKMKPKAAIKYVNFMEEMGY